MKVWITKYALTQGIEEKEVEEKGNGLVWVINAPWNESYYGEGKEWHRTEEAAIMKAEEMRVKKIESLKKQIKKLEGLKFE